MPKRVEPKSEVVFRVAKPRERPYLLTDGNGLALRVWPDGSKTWLLRYRRPSTGKENFLSLGPYPDITLVDARRSATTARNLVREGIDPVAYRQAESIARKRVAEGAFHLVAQRWLDFKRKEWADETYRKAEFVVREYLTPALRNKPISTLATPEVKPVLEAIASHAPRLPPILGAMRNVLPLDKHGRRRTNLALVNKRSRVGRYFVAYSDNVITQTNENMANFFRGRRNSSPSGAELRG
ncbi:integrase arm-type DNA-binding domain-containing protein [Paraburkholderia sp. GAS334]|uniref:integrase arm-type DNA-binding domain-containing protein n=1 Tax=Paraburkholderia sp. GAS334 TaxID=3035131 RepID=UPI003D1F7AE5